MKKSTVKIINTIRNILIFHRDLGVESYPLTKGIKKFLVRTADLRRDRPAPLKRPQSFPKKITGKPQKPQPLSSQPAPDIPKISLAEIRQELGECTRCRLHEHRQRIIFGAGNKTADLFIVEDQPGPAEEASSTPLSGEPGELLDKMLAAIGLSRREVYITSLVKCAPPDGRNPDPLEIKTCLPFLRRQLASVSPKVICAMGPHAARILTSLNKPVSRLRGRFYTFDGFAVMPTFHPEFLLKNAEMKKPAWIDLQMIRQKLTL